MIEIEFEKNCEVLVYDSTKNKYEAFLQTLPEIFEMHGVKDNVSVDEKTLEQMARDIRWNLFSDPDILMNNVEEDIKDLLRYFIQSGQVPTFIPFSERDKLDVKTIAQYIFDNDLGAKKKRAYIDSIWEDDTNLFKVYFGNNKLYFRKCIENHYCCIKIIRIFRLIISAVQSQKKEIPN
ncbi:MAG: hypothetical protein LRY71_00250 [Bacillaceae bacterium]|nr:hypothetical protein [Bacillaceae bacterium]